MLWLSITGGALLIQRAIVGECKENQVRTICNPQADDNMLPFDTLLAMVASIIVIPIILKAHDAFYAYASMGVTAGAIAVAVIISNAYNELFLLVAYLLALAFCLFDYEQSLLNFFISSRKAQSYFLESLKQARDNSSTQLENEQMVYLMVRIYISTK